MSGTNSGNITTSQTSSTGLEGCNSASKESFETKSKHNTSDTGISVTENMITNKEVIVESIQSPSVQSDTLVKAKDKHDVSSGGWVIKSRYATASGGGWSKASTAV